MRGRGTRTSKPSRASGTSRIPTTPRASSTSRIPITSSTANTFRTSETAPVRAPGTPRTPRTPGSGTFTYSFLNNSPRRDCFRGGVSRESSPSPFFRHNKSNSVPVISIRNAFNFNDFMEAAISGMKGVIIAYIESNCRDSQADVNPIDETDEEGNTALILASREGHCDIVEELLNAGADAEKANRRGKTALIYSVLYFHSEVLKLLIQRRSNLNVKYNNRTLLECVEYIVAKKPGKIRSWNHAYEVVKLLVQAGASLLRADGSPIVIQNVAMNEIIRKAAQKSTTQLVNECVLKLQGLQYFCRTKNINPSVFDNLFLEMSRLVDAIPEPRENKKEFVETTIALSDGLKFFARGIAREAIDDEKKSENNVGEKRETGPKSEDLDLDLPSIVLGGNGQE